MTIIQFFAILRARWKVCVSIFVCVVAVVLLGSLALPKKYTAVASVVLDAKPDPLSAVLFNGSMSPGYIQTQIDVIQSDRVAYKVVKLLKLTESAQARQQWEAAGREGTFEQWLAANFSRGMDVKPGRESNVINITYKAPDPRFAAALANAFVQAYLEVNLELKTEPAKQYSNYFETRAKEAREALGVARAKVSEFQKAKGIIATDERLDVESGRLNDLSTQLVGAQSLAADSNSRERQAVGASGSQMAEVLNNPVVAGLQGDMSRTEAKLQELSARYGDAHPQVIEAKANIAELRRKIDIETRKVTTSVGVSNSINSQRVGELRAALDAQRQKVLQMKAVREEGQLLVQDAENAQRNYDLVVQRLNQSSLESQATQTNVSQLTQAQAPTDPSSPQLVLNTAVSVFVGVLLAVAVALILELNDRRVRSADDVVQAIGVPVIGVLPSPNARRLFTATHANQLMQKRLLGQSGSAARGA
jgi:chain length determinant protein EpsF